MVTTQELKQKGIKAIEEAINSYGEAVISDNGESKYIVIDINSYDDYLSYRLDKDYQQATKEIQAGEFERVSSLEDIQKHIQEL